MMADTINIPKLGPVKKTQIYAIAGVAGGVLVYAYWKSNSGASDAEDVAAAPPEPEDPFEGSFGTNGGTSGDGSVSGYPSTSDTQSTAPRTNAEWSQLVAEKLADSYEPAVINGALGRYLGRQPLSSLDQDVVRAAIARAGYPPEGSFTVITSGAGGGTTDLTVAPSGVKGTASGTTIVVTWGAVAGASSYYLHRNDQGNPSVATGTSATMYNLTPGRVYKIQVGAVSAAGKEGPLSPQILVAAAKPTMSPPTGLHWLHINRTSADFACKPVAGAQYYHWYLNGAAKGATDTPGPLMMNGLKPNTTYKITVSADAQNVPAGKQSAPLTIRTKK